MRLNDLLAGVLLFLAGAAVALYALTFPSTPGAGIGPGGFPLLIGIGLSLSGAILAWGGRKERGVPRLDADETPVSPRLAFNGALVIGALVFYALAAEIVGFFVAGFVFLASLFLAFGVGRRWVAPLAAVVTVGIHVAFYTLLRVPLPWGWFEGMAW